MELGVVDGRPLTQEDGEESKKVAVITLAKQLSVGDSLQLLDSPVAFDEREIVGVVEDGPAAQGVPEVYIPYDQAPPLVSHFFI